MKTFHDRKSPGRTIEAQPWLMGEAFDRISDGPGPAKSHSRSCNDDGTALRPKQAYSAPMRLTTGGRCFACGAAVDDHGHVLRENGQPEVPGRPVCPNDWIVKDTPNAKKPLDYRVYPMKPDVFDKKWVSVA